MDKLKLYVIRHKPSGKMLPARFGTSRGFTNDEPEEIRSGANMPRVFLTEAAARRALSAWLKGRWECSRGYHQTMDGSEYDEDLQIKPEPGRVATDMEVIPADLIWGPLRAVLFPHGECVCGAPARKHHPLCESCDTIQDLNDD